MRFLINAFVIVFALFSIGLAVKFYQNSITATDELNKERYSRMVAEEKLTSLDSKVNAMEIDLARSRNEADALQRRISEIQKENAALKTKISSVEIMAHEAAAQAVVDRAP